MNIHLSETIMARGQKVTCYFCSKPIPGPRQDTRVPEGQPVLPLCRTSEKSSIRPPKQLPWGRTGCRLTISLTRCGPGHHCSEPASQVRISRAAGSLTTSPGPGETCVHTSRLWGAGFGPDPWAIQEAAYRSRGTFLAAGLHPAGVGIGATRF